METRSTAKAPEARLYDRVLVAVGRTPNGKQINAEAAGVQVDEIRVQGSAVTLRGSTGAMGSLVESTRAGTNPSAVPTFGVDWRARQDSNLRPTDS